MSCTFRWQMVLCLLIVGCANAPPVDDDIARADADPRIRFDVLRSQGERIAGTPFIDGNAVQLLRDGPSSYAAMLAAIAGARVRVELESYEFDPAVGAQFANALIAAHDRGAAVYLVYDAWGSRATPTALFDRLRNAGIRVLEYNSIDLDRRDHRKLLVVDGRIAVSGGVNISSVNLGRPSSAGAVDDASAQPWRDTDIRVEGPAVVEYERCFLEIWHQQKASPPEPLPDPPIARAGGFAVQVVADIPAQHEHAIYRSLLVAIALARRSIDLTTGFFAPTPDLLHALRAAARRGVDVELLVAGVSDSTLAVEAGRSHYEDLLEDGVHIHEFRGRVLHAKTAVIDGDWCTVGSSNLDWRSVQLNNELNTVIISAALGQQMEAMFRDDVAQAQPIERRAWSHRSIGERFLEWHGRLVEEFL